jgi:hypothetical protein
MRFKVTFYPGSPHEFTIDENEFATPKMGDGSILIGLDGKVYENYGNNRWEEVFDADYKITWYEGQGRFSALWEKA